MKLTKIKQGKKRLKLKVKMLLSIIILVISGVIYEQIGRSMDRKAYPPPGQLVNVAGHDMHIWSEGAGDATVVFGVGYQMPSGYVDFYPLYNEISKHARVAVYDRPGYGWSEVTEDPRDIDTITEEIHEVLEKSGEKPPYVFVAHSIASLEAIRFAQRYSDEVVGVVLIDGSSPDMYTGLEKLPSETFAYKRTLFTKKAMSIANEIGAFRLLLNTVYPYSSCILSIGRNGMEQAPEQLKEIDQSLIHTFNNKSQVGERDWKEVNAFKILEDGYLGDIPLRIITSEYLNNYDDSKRLQNELLSWSTDSKQTIVEGAGHAVHWYRPDLINVEILNILVNNAPTETRGKAQLYEGIYSDNRLFGDSDRDDYPSTTYEIVISNVTDTTFDFAVYEETIVAEESALISPKHTAVFSEDGTEATYSGDDYNLTFVFPDYHETYPVVTDIEILGFAPFEGNTYVNNSIPGYEFS